MHRLLVAVTCAATLSIAAVRAQSDDARCSNLVMLRLPDVKISEAVAVPAATTGAVRAPHCKVSGVIGREIRFALLLPDTWNRKLLMGGGGGFVGTIDNQSQFVVNDGFATVGTDTGHQGMVTDASWALDNVERQLNFGHLAVHRTAEVAKAIVRSYYRSNETRSYFAGCSNGGRQALMEAQRYPADFDGIVAGAPALDFVGIATQFIKDVQAAFPDSRNPAPMFTPETLKAVETQILDTCDALDGVKDSVMEDPRRCKVDVAALTGLTVVQRSALGKIYAATAARGDMIYPAQPMGGEGERAGWTTWITGAQSLPAAVPQGPSLRFAFGTQFFKYFVYGDPNWDYSSYEIGKARRDAKLVGTMLNATDPNLDGFKARGGKLILWHGWSDPALTALASVRYHEQVYARDPNARDYFRTFMMPGVLHCAGGPGPDVVDWPAAIDDWVEKGKAPDRIIARKMVNNAIARSRPLCPYPQKAEYKGTGSTDDEANFVCK
jgi:feruloyl esterase